ncbi:MAG TPA: hypothetical protein VMB25_03270 [Bryobacteraceae bacterium]|nr:hypothetical protein [Bryobacteraceae bacterium]
MPDKIRAVASFGDDPTKIEIILPPGDPQVMLADVATKPNFQLFGTALSYSYAEQELAKRPAQPANTLIEIGVPYCFHVPINTMFMLRDAKGTSHLVFKKVWTIRAEGSSDADYLSPTHVLYHNKTSIKTPNFPTEPNFGPEPICTGTNVEALKDKAGLYRYSLVWIFFDTAYTREMLTSENGGQLARSEIIAHAVAGINRFIDIYRVVTNSAHIQRISSVHVRDIFFEEHNIGFHGASFGHGIGTATMNRSGAELNEIAGKAATGQEIPVWDLLFLDAEASLETNAFTLAVVNAFQALELRLEDFLGTKMKAQGLSTPDIEERLGRIWRTKERLKDLVPSLAGRRMIDDDPKLWDHFCWAYDDIRNKLIHAARDLDHDKTERAVSACRDVGRWLDAIV